MPSSESVWFEQVDIALINYIKNIVKLKNSYGVLVPVPVKIRKADEDFKIEEYPSITLYNTGSRKDIIRQYPEKVVVAVNKATNTLTEEYAAIPYSLYYNLDFWSKTQSEMNDMTRIWLGNHPDNIINLPVKDVSGNDRNSLVQMLGGLNKADYLTQTERTFHQVITYRIWVELDERVQNTVDGIMGNVQINTLPIT